MSRPECTRAAFAGRPESSSTSDVIVMPVAPLTLPAGRWRRQSGQHPAGELGVLDAALRMCCVFSASKPMDARLIDD